MDTEALRVLAENRAQSDTKSLKKAIKEFYSLLKPTLKGDQLEASHTTFNISLDQLSTHLSKCEKIRNMTSFEIDNYHSEQLSIDQASEETRSKIEELKKRLIAAKGERSRRIEYDHLSKIIGKLPDREKGIESQKKLLDDISLLKMEEENYSQTWSTRKDNFDSIVKALETMQEAIRDEKAEQERRRALDDDNDAEPEPEDSQINTMGEGGAQLDPNAREFVPGKKEGEGGQEEEDVEMGEAREEGEEEGEEREMNKGDEGDGERKAEESVEEGEMDTQ
ncbi:hypothetical protein JCM5353_006490 [Sporobolomyces roseus]